MASLEQWIKDFPVITRTYMAAALLTTAACALDILSPFSLYYSWTMIWDRGQFWRLFTNFFFFGAKFSLEFLFHMFFLVQYCRSLEEGSFRGRTADFFWMIVLGATALVVVAPFAHMHFLGSSLSFMMVYLWARRNPFVRMSFLGLFTFTAPYLPWVLLGFSFLLGHDAMADSLGIAIGHLYYFLEDVYPLMTPTRTRILKTPKIIELLFSGANAIPAAEHPQILFENEVMIQQAIQAQQQAAAEQAAVQQAAAGQQGQPQQPPQQQAPPQPDAEDEGFILAH